MRPFKTPAKTDFISSRWSWAAFLVLHKLNVRELFVEHSSGFHKFVTSPTYDSEEPKSTKLQFASTIQGSHIWL